MSITKWWSYAEANKKDMPNSLSRMLLNKHFCSVVENCWDIYDKKGHDYTRGKGDEDRIDNFRQSAENNGVTTLQSWGVLWYKHVAAVWTFVKKGKVNSEPIDGRLYDVINYVILLLLIIEEEKAKQGQGTP